MRNIALILLAVLMTALFSCTGTVEKRSSAGKLFIIGGGEKSDSMMKELVTLAKAGETGYVFILPMASAYPDSAILWTKEDFVGSGAGKVTGYVFAKGELPPAEKLDSLKNAPLIFISGGDQERFMETVRNTPVYDAIMYAHEKGSVIAGTSAGAAVMSRKMITGNQKKHPDPEAGFKTIEPENVEITEGLGFLTTAIIDQHFIKRQRLNRLISVSIENPEELCIGIDESTAIIVDGDSAKVTGQNQVIVLRNPGPEKRIRNGLLGKMGLQLSVYLPGESFLLK